MNVQLERIELLHGRLLLAVAAAAALGSWRCSAGVFLGGLVMGGEFRLNRELARRLVGRGAVPGRAVVSGLAFLKFSLFLGLLGLFFWRVPVDGLSFGLGATLLPVACVLETLRGRWRVAA